MKEAAKVLTETALAKKNESLLEQVRAQVAKDIASAKSYDAFLALGASVVAQRKGVEAFFKPLKRAQDLAKKAILDREHAMLDAWAPIEKRIREETSRWFAECEAKAQEKAEEERKAQIKEAKADGNRVLVAELRQAPIEAENAAERDAVDFARDVEIEIVDLEAVPRQWLRCELRVAEVKKAFLSGEAKEIPGLRLSEKKRTIFK